MSQEDGARVTITNVGGGQTSTGEDIEALRYPVPFDCWWEKPDGSVDSLRRVCARVTDEKDKVLGNTIAVTGQVQVGGVESGASQTRYFASSRAASDVPLLLLIVGVLALIGYRWRMSRPLTDAQKRAYGRHLPPHLQSRED